MILPESFYMDFDIQTTFIPSVGIDVIFNINSLSPYSRSSIIYDTDYKNNTITIAQPLTPLSKNTKFKELHLSTIIQGENRRIRVGLPCQKFQRIERYPLASGKMIQAALMTIVPPAKEINIRSSFRLPMTSNYVIKSKILYQKFEYYTPRDFSVRDISLTGLGLLIPKKRKKIETPLSQIEINQEIRIGIILVNSQENIPIATIPLKTQIARINPNHSQTHLLAGLKVLKMRREDETVLNQFIHDAQIDELKRLSRRNL